MKKKFIPFLLLIAFTLSFGGCVGDDIDDLQNQIDELDQKVDELEQAQQAALLAAIADMQAAIAALSGDVDEQYATLLANLQSLEEEVANNKDAVYYGNLITDADFTAFTNQGASIVTGKVVATTQAHVDALALAKMIGGNLTLSGGTTITLPALESVGGDLSITEVADTDAAVSLPVLASVGGDFDIYNTITLVSANMSELILISGNLTVENNTEFTTLNMAKLDLINGNIEFDELNPTDPNQWGNLVSIDLSSVNVQGYVECRYLGFGAELNFGTVKGDLSIIETGIAKLEILNQSYEEDMNISGNKSLNTLSFPLLTTIKGDLTIYYNKSIPNLNAFNNVTIIEGDIVIDSNGFESLEAFNNVIEVGGNISITGNGNLESIDVFNNLDGFYENGSRLSSSRLKDVTISGGCKWFTGFNKLEEVRNLDLMLYQTQTANYEREGQCQVDGFDALTYVYTLNLELTEVIGFNALPVLADFGNKYGSYLKVDMPINDPEYRDVNNPLSLCSMSEILTSVKNGAFDVSPSSEAIFFDVMDWNEVDRDAAIDELLAPCAQ